MDDDDGKIPAAHVDEVARFYNAHARWLFGHAVLRAELNVETAGTARKEFAADLVQDTFEAAARSWETLRSLPAGQQRAWLLTALSNKNISHFRRRVTHRRRQPDLYRRYQAKEPDPEQQALYRLALERTAKIIESMSARQKTIVLMKWDDHMTEAEIADALGCSKGTIAVEVRNIRRRLTDEIGPYYPFDGEGKVSS